MEYFAVNVMKNINKRYILYKSACGHELCSRHENTLTNLFRHKKEKCIIPLVTDELCENLKEKGVPKEIISIIKNYYMLSFNIKRKLAQSHIPFE